MVSNLFTGDQILAESSMKSSVHLTRTQTAKSAAKSIRKKYGTISRTERYYHRGGGEWVQYAHEQFLADSKKASPRQTKTSPNTASIAKMRLLRKGAAKVGDTVYSKLIDGTYVERKVKFIEDRGFHRILHTVKISKTGKIGKRVSTSTEGDFYIAGERR